MKNCIVFFWIIIFFLSGRGMSQSSMTGKEKYPFKSGFAVSVFAYPDTAAIVNGVYIINDNGEINLPLVGRVSVDKMTEFDFKNLLKSSYSKYVKAVVFQVDILYRISLIGGFVTPGLYYAPPDETLWEVIQKGGGFLEEKGFKKLKIYRGKKKIYDNLANEFSLGLTLRQMSLRSGDVVTVPIPIVPVSRMDRILQVVGLVATTVTIYALYITTVVRVRGG